MYSSQLKSELSKRGAETGDQVRITRRGVTFEGILMPKTTLSSPSTITLKVASGYNVGVEYEEGTRIEVLRKGKAVEFAPAANLPEKDPKKPSVTILGSGGTIGSRVEYLLGSVYPAFSPQDLVLAVPELKELANVDGRKIFDLFSNDITAEHWKILCEEIQKEIRSAVNGVIVTHGTDTMCYTSSALNFMLRNPPVPIVMVGSQRSSDRGSSDNYVNLVCSVLTACNSDIAEVSVCMHGEEGDEFCYVHQGTKCRKMHTSRRDAFRSINVLPFAKVWYREKRIDYLRNDFHKRGQGEFYLDTKINPNVLMLYEHPNLRPEIIDRLANKIDGLVVVATGLGHVHTNRYNDPIGVSILEALENLIKSGIPVVFAPQTLYGRLNLNVYASGRTLKGAGIIGDGADWLPETAYVKLMWVLGHTTDMDEIKEMMMKNVAGEISERTINEAYLA